MTQPVGFHGIDMSDPQQRLAWALTSMPSQIENGLWVPIPTKAIPAWSAHLDWLGVDFNPERQRGFPIPSAQPGMGWMSPMTWVDRDEYDKYLETKKTPSATDPMAQIEALMASFDPALAARLKAMSPEQLREYIASQESAFQGAMAQMQTLRDAMDRQEGRTTE